MRGESSVAGRGILTGKFYKLTNTSGLDIHMSIKNQNGEIVEDVLYADEVVYGVNEQAVRYLDFYISAGLIKIEESELENGKVHWLTEGF